MSEGLQLLPKAYDDLLKPSAQELGKGLNTIARSLNIVLSPLAGLVWGFDRLKLFLEEDVSQRLAVRKTKSITTPAPSVAVPALMALTYLGSESELRDLFANLLVSATDTATAGKVHPAFVEIIKQLSKDEAKILASLRSRANFPVICEGTYRDDDFHDAHSMLSEIYAEFGRLCTSVGIPEGTESGPYLDNLLRLRLFEIKEVGDVELKERTRGFFLNADGETSGIELRRTRYEALYVTKLGILFLDLCVTNPEGPNRATEPSP